MTGGLLQLSGVVADLLYSVEHVPAPGQEALVTGFQIAPGGGFNAMVAAKRAGMTVSYGGSIGSGPFATIARAGLDAQAIPTLRNKDMARDQGCCTVLIDRDGERTFIASDGAEGHVSPGDLDQIPFDDFEWTLLSGYALHYPNSRAALSDWLRRDTSRAQLVFDPAPIIGALAPQDVQAALSRANWISANLQEASILTGHSDAVMAAKALARDRTGGAIVRNGAAGCVLATGQACIEIPPFEVAAIDTNGAGDAHIGSFIARLSQTQDPQRAAEFANVAAALSTTIKGPATAPTAQQVAAAQNLPPHNAPKRPIQSNKENTK